MGNTGIWNERRPRKAVGAARSPVADETWSAISDMLRERLGKNSEGIASLGTVIPLEAYGDTIVLVTPNIRVAGWVESRCRTEIVRAFAETSPVPPSSPSIADVQSVVKRRYGVSHEDLVSCKRAKNIAFARHIAIYLARYMTEETLASIGEKFGGRDHTTVMYSVIKIERQMADTPKLQEHVTQLADEIRESCKR